MNRIVDIAEVRVSNDPCVDLVTHSLGSCIGIAVWDPEVRVGGMIHYMLPDSSIASHEAKTNPAMFADTGIPKLLQSVEKLGASKKRLIVKLAGGSSLLDGDARFNIGKRNYDMLHKIFQENGISIDSENVGGSLSRTLRLSVATGRVTVTMQGKEFEL